MRFHNVVHAEKTFPDRARIALWGQCIIACFAAFPTIGPQVIVRSVAKMLPTVETDDEIESVLESEDNMSEEVEGKEAESVVVKSN